MVKFDKDSHTYTNILTDEKYISVTTLLGKYVKPFDSDYHAERVAKREGVSKEFILSIWKEQNNTANEKGTKIHKLLEDYIGEGIMDNMYGWLYGAYDRVLSEVVSKYDIVLSEHMLYNHEYKIAGTSDLIYDHGDTFTVADFKTNKEFKFENKYNEYLLDPVSHIMYSQFSVYALQLSLYAHLHELDTGKKCRKLVSLYLKDDKIVPYHFNYLKTDIINILDHYRLNSCK
jgi:ATP-dependent exoDNAse (exonuclease V) beta subunit